MPDDDGFGHDIDVITQTLDVLEAHPRVKMSWEFDSWQTLEQRLPTYAPDLYERIRARVRDRDEVRFMSWNGGVVSAQTPEEFEASIVWQRESLLRVFGKVENGVYPQEMMHTPSLVSAYRNLGVEWVSLFYSTSPFTAFRNEVLLEGRELYNPLWLETPEADARMVVLPTYHHSDVADFLGLATWADYIRRTVDGDALLFIAFDADGSSWPLILELFLPGLERLPFVEFCTPGEYLAGHEQVGTIVLHRDQADGVFDGYSSWAEKPVNHEIWTAVEASRLGQDRARFLLDRFSLVLPEASSLLEENFRWRMQTLKTTHFGLATPELHPDRLQAARQHAEQIRALSGQALALAEDRARPQAVALAGALPALPFAGSSRPYYVYRPQPSRGAALVRIPVACGEGQCFPGGLRVYRDGEELPSGLLKLKRYGDGSVEKAVLVFAYELAQAGEGIYWVTRSSDPGVPDPDYGLVSEGPDLENGVVTVRFDSNGWPASLERGGLDFTAGRFLYPGVTYEGLYAGPERLLPPDGTARASGRGFFQEVGRRGSYAVSCENRTHPSSLTYRFRVYAGLPALEIEADVSFPDLQAPCRDGLTEAMPLGILPAVTGERLRVWKHNYFGYTGSYDVSGPADSLNSHVTASWVAVSDGVRGALVAYNASELAGLAFCPLKVKEGLSGGLGAALNPFGSFRGAMPDHQSRRTGGLGLGEILTLALGVQFKPSARAYAGARSLFSVVVVPYAGDKPPEEDRNLAEAYSYPPGCLRLPES